MVRLINLKRNFKNKIFNYKGDKIIWLSDNGIEEGVVKWLGILPDVGKDWMAGVQFLNAVGSGTGLYNNQQLFVGK